MASIILAAAGTVAKHCGILTAPDRFVHVYERTAVRR
jgi:hypothetical protein